MGTTQVSAVDTKLEAVAIPVSDVDRAMAGTTLEPALNGRTVVVLGGSAGMGLETARRARAAGAEVILTGRNAEALQRAAREVGALDVSAFDAMDPVSLETFFRDLPRSIDHVMVAAGRPPSYGRLVDMNAAQARDAVDEHLRMAVEVARNAAGKMVPGGSLVFMSGIGARRLAAGLGAASVAIASLPVLVANLALELAPIRVNLLAAGFVDTRLSAALLGDQLEKRRDYLRATLPIRRVVGPGDIASFAVHLMSNTALTGATYDIDGGQQLVE